MEKIEKIAARPERYAGAPSPTVERCLGQVIPLKRDFRASQASFVHSSGLDSGIHLIVADPTSVVPGSKKSRTY